MAYLLLLHCYKIMLKRLKSFPRSKARGQVGKCVNGFHNISKKVLRLHAPISNLKLDHMDRTSPKSSWFLGKMSQNMIKLLPTKIRHNELLIKQSKVTI